MLKILESERYKWFFIITILAIIGLGLGVAIDKSPAHFISKQGYDAVEIVQHKVICSKGKGYYFTAKDKDSFILGRACIETDFIEINVISKTTLK